MLSNRNTPFDADGFALLVEDMRRLAKSVYGGSNDLNADAIPVNQETADIGSELDEHIAAADPHPQYQLLADVVAPFDPEYLNVYTGTPETNASPGGTIQLTTAFGTPSGSMSASFSSGVFTAPGDGMYLITFGVNGSANLNTTGTKTCTAYIVLNGAATLAKILVSDVQSGSALLQFFAEIVTAYVHLSAGNTLTFFFGMSNSGGFSSSGSLGINNLDIVRLSES